MDISADIRGHTSHTHPFTYSHTHTYIYALTQIYNGIFLRRNNTNLIYLFSAVPHLISYLSYSYPSALYAWAVSQTPLQFPYKHLTLFTTLCFYYVRRTLVKISGKEHNLIQRVVTSCNHNYPRFLKHLPVSFTMLR